jgi:hypothetical protein
MRRREGWKNTLMIRTSPANSPQQPPGHVDSWRWDAIRYRQLVDGSVGCSLGACFLFFFWAPMRNCHPLIPNPLVFRSQTLKFFLVAEIILLVNTFNM